MRITASASERRATDPDGVAVSDGMPVWKSALPGLASSLRPAAARGSLECLESVVETQTAFSTERLVEGTAVVDATSALGTAGLKDAELGSAEGGIHSAGSLESDSGEAIVSSVGKAAEARPAVVGVKAVRLQDGDRSPEVTELDGFEP